MATFWHNPDGAEGARDDELRNAEKQLGFTLPQELKQLLTLRDGGIPNYDLFGNILLCPFRGVANKADTGNLVKLHLEGGEETLPADVVIFAAGPDAWFGLDYRTSRACPSVLHWSEYEDEPVTLAATFREFLDKLSSE
jgi:hypothetical protein